MTCTSVPVYARGATRGTAESTTPNARPWRRTSVRRSATVDSSLATQPNGRLRLRRAEDDRGEEPASTPEHLIHRRREEDPLGEAIELLDRRRREAAGHVLGQRAELEP